jgi:putative Mn2+ efflux pump MntP
MSMVLARLIAFVVPLGLGTFAMSAALGLSGLSANRRLKLSSLFASFEGATPVVGLLLGGVQGRAIGDGADYLAGVLLVIYGLYTGLARKDNETGPANKLVTAHGAALLLSRAVGTAR